MLLYGGEIQVVKKADTSFETKSGRKPNPHSPVPLDA
jgi:hypothetical protein